MHNPSSAIAGPGLTTRQTGSCPLSPDNESATDFEEQNDAGAVDAESSYLEDIRLNPEEESDTADDSGRRIWCNTFRWSTESLFNLENLHGAASFEHGGRWLRTSG